MLAITFGLMIVIGGPLMFAEYLPGAVPTMTDEDLEVMFFGELL